MKFNKKKYIFKRFNSIIKILKYKIFNPFIYVYILNIMNNSKIIYLK